MGGNPYIPYSRRMAQQERGDAPIPYRFDTIPVGFRNQVVHIWDRAIGTPTYNTYQGTLRRNPFWVELRNQIAEEQEKANLGHTSLNEGHQCAYYFREVDSQSALDIIEMSFNLINTRVRAVFDREGAIYRITQNPDDAIADLNRRFREQAIGYEFREGEMFRIDSEFIHAEMVEPAIALLHRVAFKGASDEFMKAHEHYRHGRNKEAVTVALSAFESTMKAICEKRTWGYKPHDSAGALITTIWRNNLIPERFRKQFDQLEQLLVGLATVRNTSGAHGQGTNVIETPDYIAAYALHQAAANIVLLVEAHNALP